MRHISLRHIAVFLAIVPLGCMSVRTTYYDIDTRPARLADSVEVFDVRDVNQPYKVIGLVEVSASELYDVRNVVQRLKKAAGQMGGDAISDLQCKSGATGVPVTPDGETHLGYFWNSCSAKVLVWQKTR